MMHTIPVTIPRRLLVLAARYLIVNRTMTVSLISVWTRMHTISLSPATTRTASARPAPNKDSVCEASADKDHGYHFEEASDIVHSNVREPATSSNRVLARARIKC